MEKGRIYKMDLTPTATSNFFQKGHRIRIEVPSSNFPRLRNLNTGGRNHDEKNSVVALTKVHHLPDYPSRIVLPVVSK
jgi:predicted acyl esterase